MGQRNGAPGWCRIAPGCGFARAIMPILDWCLIVVDRRSIRAPSAPTTCATCWPSHASRNRRSAASDLGVDTSTVTRRIRALERALGTELVRQNAAGWELTEAGRTVAETAGPIEDAVERVAGAVAGDQGRTLRGNVRVTAPDAFGAYFVAPALVGCTGGTRSDRRAADRHARAEPAPIRVLIRRSPSGRRRAGRS